MSFNVAFSVDSGNLLYSLGRRRAENESSPSIRLANSTAEMAKIDVRHVQTMENITNLQEQSRQPSKSIESKVGNVLQAECSELRHSSQVYEADPPTVDMSANSTQ